MAEYIIIEGPDGAGKSTLVKSILESHPGTVYGHFDKPESDEEAFGYWEKYAAFIKEHQDAKLVVLDRSWYSDMVYGPVMRGRIEMTDDHMEMLELLVKACGGGIIIYLTAKPDTLWSRCKRRGESYIDTRTTLVRIREKYEEVMKKPRYLPVIRTDTGVNW